MRNCINEPSEARCCIRTRTAMWSAPSRSRGSTRAQGVRCEAVQGTTHGCLGANRRLPAHMGGGSIFVLWRRIGEPDNLIDRGGQSHAALRQAPCHGLRNGLCDDIQTLVFGQTPPGASNCASPNRGTTMQRTATGTSRCDGASWTRGLNFLMLTCAPCLRAGILPCLVSAWSPRRRRPRALACGRAGDEQRHTP